jgi:hypothetical protein
MQHGGRVACGEGLDPDRYRVSHEATLVLLMGVALCGCSRSHAAGEADAGGPSWDLGPFIVDEGPVVLPAVCLDEPCAIEGESCNERVCWEARYAGIYSTYVEAPQCSFAANSAAASVTWNGEPCGVAEHGADGEQRGHRRSSRALRGSPRSREHGGPTVWRVVPTGCIWSDGLPVTAVAPETPCTGFEPAVITGGVEVFLRGFCGGTCGTAGCPALDGSSFCVGRSDERSFGACARTSLRCRAPSFTWMSRASVLPSLATENPVSAWSRTPSTRTSWSSWGGRYRRVFASGTETRSPRAWSAATLRSGSSSRPLVYGGIVVCIATADAGMLAPA